MVFFVSALLTLPIVAAAAWFVARHFRERTRKTDYAQYLLDQFRFLKSEIGMEPDWIVETADEYHELLEQIEFSIYVDDDDRFPLRDMLEAEFYDPIVDAERLPHFLRPRASQSGD